MSRLILILGIASALLLVVLGQLLMHWWETDRDNFWIAISIYGFCFVVFVMLYATAKPKESDDTEEHF